MIDILLSLANMFYPNALVQADSNAVEVNITGVTFSSSNTWQDNITDGSTSAVAYGIYANGRQRMDITVNVTANCNGNSCKDSDLEEIKSYLASSFWLVDFSTKQQLNYISGYTAASNTSKVTGLTFEGFKDYHFSKLHYTVGKLQPTNSYSSFSQIENSYSSQSNTFSHTWSLATDETGIKKICTKFNDKNFVVNGTNYHLNQLDGCNDNGYGNSYSFYVKGESPPKTSYSIKREILFNKCSSDSCSGNDSQVALTHFPIFLTSGASVDQLLSANLTSVSSDTSITSSHNYSNHVSFVYAYCSLAMQTSINLVETTVKSPISELLGAIVLKSSWVFARGPEMITNSLSFLINSMGRSCHSIDIAMPINGTQKGIDIIASTYFISVSQKWSSGEATFSVVDEFGNEYSFSSVMLDQF